MLASLPKAAGNVDAEILMNDHSCFNGSIKVKGKKWFSGASAFSMANTAFTPCCQAWMMPGFNLVIQFTLTFSSLFNTVL